MKRLLLALALMTISAICYAQPTYPINQTIGAPTTLVTSRGGFKADSSLIVPAYLDTAKANISPYGKNYAGAVIRVGDSLYMRNASATKWINLSQSGGGGGGNSWLVGGNTDAIPPYIGTKDEKELDFITFDSVRMRIPSNGVKRLQGGARKYLLYDTTTKYVYYGDGGVGTTPSLQQVTDVDSVTTNNIYVNQINYYDSLVAPQHTVKTKVLDGGFYVYSNIFNSNLFYVDAYDGFKSYNTTTGSISSFKNGNVTGTKEYYLPDTSGTLALKEYTIDSLKRNPGTDSVFAQKNGQWVFQYRDSVGVSGGGGGGGKIYYFNGGVSMGTFGGIAMYELGDTAVTGTAADFTRATTGNIANFITNVDKPGLIQIPAGVWTIDAYFSETGGGSNNAEIYAILEKWDGSTLTVIATSPIEQLTNGSVKDLYTFAISVPTTTLSITDRIVIQFYIQNTNGKTVTLYTQNGNVGEVHTTFTTGIGALNGLTAPTQTFAVGTSGTDFNISSATSTHTFNLPTASATNRGALSTTDWSTFNGKIGPSDTATMLSPYLRKVDTISLSNRINLKLNISDTAAMLSPYLLNVPRVAYLANDFTTTSTTAVSTNLSIPVEANTAYRIMISGSASKATSSTGMKISISAPTGTTIKATASLGGNAISTIANSFITSVNSLGATFATGVGVEVPFRVEGILVTGSNAGSITLQGATVTSNTATIYASTLMTISTAYSQ
jgi:hypothetical protein